MSLQFETPSISTKMAVSKLSVHEINKLSDELACLYNNEKFSDGILVVEDFEIPIHKMILALRSPYFE